MAIPPTPCAPRRTMGAPDDPRIERLDQVLGQLAVWDDLGVREKVAELVEGIRWLHAEGLKRLTDLLAEEPGLLRRALDDPQVSNLLLLYDLVIVDQHERVREVMESMRPFMRSHGGEIEVLGVEEGVVRVRLLGSCHGCPSSTATLRQGIEQALAERLPGFRGIVVEGEDPLAGAEEAGNARLNGRDGGDGRAAAGEPVSFVPVQRLLDLEEQITATETEEGAVGPWEADLGPLDGLPSGTLHGALVDNYPILLIRRGTQVLAYQNTCPGSLLPLHLGAVEGGIVTCPWHGCRFRVETGERLAGTGPPLHALGARVEGGRVRVIVR